VKAGGTWGKRKIPNARKGELPDVPKESVGFTVFGLTRRTDDDPLTKNAYQKYGGLARGKKKGNQQ